MKRIYITVFLLLLAVVGWSLELLPPMDSYWISSDSGYRRRPMGGKDESQLHKGIDMVGPHRAPIMAAASGVVVEHWPAPNGYYYGHPMYGGLIVIDLLNGTHTLYAHMSSTYMGEGDQVEAGQVIGRQGDTGITTGEHLHFEVIINPLIYITNRWNIGLDGTER